MQKKNEMGDHIVPVLNFSLLCVVGGKRCSLVYGTM